MCKIVAINKCGDCPHILNLSLCSLYSDRPIDVIHDIPIWCPLSDKPVDCDKSVITEFFKDTLYDFSEAIHDGLKPDLDYLAEHQYNVIKKYII